MRKRSKKEKKNWGRNEEGKKKRVRNRKHDMLKGNE